MDLRRQTINIETDGSRSDVPGGCVSRAPHASYERFPELNATV